MSLKRFGWLFTILLLVSAGAGPVAAQIRANATGTTTSATTWYNTASSVTAYAGSTVTLEVQVASGDSTVTTTPSGTVTFYTSTGTQLGSATLSSGLATLTLSTSSLSTGTYTIYASYGGDTTFASSTSTTIKLIVSSKIKTSVTLTASSSTVSVGGSVTLKAVVTPEEQSDSENYPTGTVEFLNGTTVLGSATLTQVGSTDSSMASLVVRESTLLTAGTASVTAYYEGDTYYASSTSSAVALTVEDFAITYDSNTSTSGLTITKGSSASATFDVSAEGGFSGTVNVTCTVPANIYLTCATTPQSVTVPGTATFVVTTYKTGSLSASARRDGSHAPWARAISGTALAMLGIFVMPWGRRARTLLVRSAGERGKKALLLLLLLAGVGLTGVGCSSSTAGVASSGTPLGQTTLTIMAIDAVDSATVYHTIYLTVNVVSGS